MDWYQQQGSMIAIGLMAGLFVFMAILELAVPARQLGHSKAKRWLTNLALFALDSVLVRVAIPLLMVGAAQWAADKNWGLFHWLELPGWAAFAVSFLLLDLALYVQHWATHRVPVLWRLHKVHHSDPDFDITTAARFHPFEIALSMGYKMAVVALLGAPIMAVFLFEALFNAAAIFTHANVALPAKLDRIVRAVLVTPSMHRIHHSVRREETDSNYSSLLSLWDRIFGTYTAEANGGAIGLTIGLEEFQDRRPERLGWSLLLPFLGEQANGMQQSDRGAN